MDNPIFIHLYQNALKTYKIEHLDCEYLKEFARAMYAFGYAEGYYNNDEELC